MVTVYCIALTLLAYGVSRMLASRFPSPFTTPVFLSSILIILVLISSGVEARDYEPAKNLLVFLLGPATVALALPIYRNRSRLAAHLAPTLGGIAVGSLATVLATLALGKLLGLAQPVLASMSTKSVTAPIAIQLAEIVRGDPSLAVAFVIVTGMLGAMFGPALLTFAGIVQPLARGLSLGTISHGQGTAQAIAEGEVQGAIAGIAMGLAAIMTSLGLPFLIDLLP
jgi:predicted murein hydrolase (TIGR00659 family)